MKDMRGILCVLIALLLCGAAPSRVVVPVEVSPDALREKLKKAGFNVAAVVAGPPNYIQWGPGGETKDPSPIIESLLDPETLRMRVLAKKWKTGTLSSTEKDELLRLFILRQLAL